MPAMSDHYTPKSIVPANPNPLQYIFEDQPIRILQDENGEPLFVASDVCKALDISNVSNVLSRLDDDEKDDLTLADVTGRMQKTAVITEPGLYNLIIRSDKPKAKDFKRWITHEVIPAIRKTGGYAMQSKNANPLEALRQMVETLIAQDRRLNEHDTRIGNLEAHVQPEVEYFTVIGYFRKRGLQSPSHNQAISIGQQAARLSKERGYSTGKTSDPRYGEVNTYHVSILDEVVKQ